MFATTAFKQPETRPFHFAVIAPAVDFTRVEDVLLLTGQTTHDLADLFSPDG